MSTPTWAHCPPLLNDTVQVAAYCSLIRFRWCLVITEGLRELPVRAGYAVRYTAHKTRSKTTGTVVASESAVVAASAPAISSAQHVVCVAARRTRGASCRTSTPCFTLAASIARSATGANSL